MKWQGLGETLAWMALTAILGWVGVTTLLLLIHYAAN